MIDSSQLARIHGPVLITGAGGFIGSHLVELCLALGLPVRALVHYNSQGRWGWLEALPEPERIEIIAGDVRDFDSVWRAMQGCPTVLHLAALIGIPYSYESPLAYIRTNVEGTYNVLEAARRLGTERVVVTSTSETYGTAQYVPIDEQHPTVAQSPYAASKVGADQLALGYHRSFGLPVAVARPFNTYGPRQSARAFIPTVVTQILAGRRRLQVGNLAPRRDLTFVEDTAAALLAIAGCNDLIGRATNIGMNQEIGMGELLARISERMGVQVDAEVEPERVRSATSEVDRLRCDHAQLVTHTGWQPSWDLERGLDRTIGWLREHQELYKPAVYHV